MGGKPFNYYYNKVILSFVYFRNYAKTWEYKNNIILKDHIVYLGRWAHNSITIKATQIETIYSIDKTKWCFKNELERIAMWKNRKMKRWNS
jgi:hypothetical protein